MGIAFNNQKLRAQFANMCVNRSKTWQANLVTNEKGIVTNATSGLKYDDYKELTEDIVKSREFDFVGNLYRTLVGAGLTRTVDISRTLIDYHDMNAFNDAHVTMDMANRENEQSNYNQKLVPLPIFHQDFVIPWRQGSFSYKESDGVSESSFRVMETRDRVLMLGDSSINVNGTEMYGYTNHPSTILAPGISDWADKANKNVVYDEMVELISQLFQNRTARENSLAVFVATDIKTALNFKNGAQNAATNTTLLTELESISEIRSVQAHQDLPAGAVLIIELVPMTSDLAIASDVRAVPWSKRDEYEDMRFTIMSSCTPRIKTDRQGRTGILYATK
jgi:uncharacterized linocin/CFP29 family protein